jgi:hypothetical protein
MAIRARFVTGVAGGLLLLIGSAVAAPPEAPATAQAVSTAPATPTEPATAAPPVETTPSEPTAWDLALEGRKLLKAKDGDGAVTKLQAALARADKDALSVEDQALIQYLLSLAAQRAGQDAVALGAARDAVRLAPKEADYQLELANQLFAVDKNEEAKRHAEESLRLGLSSEDDRKEAAKLIKDAKSALLHERFSFDVSVTAGYDSNVMQGGQAETIGGVATGVRSSDVSKQTFLQQQKDRNRELIAGLVRDYRSAIANNYVESVPSVAELDVPVTLTMELGGRLVGGGAAELWTGYRFTQLFMTSPKFDHEAYSLQEHVVPLRLMWRPRPWFWFRPRVEGFVNFTGLKSFSAFQGGVTAVLDFLFVESARWRTRVLATYQLRQTIDRDYSYLDGNRVDGKVLQELRINPSGRIWARGQLSYRFRADLSGSLEQAVDLQVVGPQGNSITVGNYTYKTPLSYLGNELAMRWRLFLPAGFDLGLGGSADFRGYREDTTASYTPNQITVPCVTAIGCSGSTTVTLPKDGTTSIALPSTRRRDTLVSLDVGVSKTLPAGFSLDLTYTFIRNVSNIANGIDNRNYVKNSILLTLYYSF